MEGKVSIIIPNYNGEKYIDKCLNSINNQVYDNIEVIVIDDGSRDNSLDIISKYKKTIKFDFKLVKQFNQNASVARNRGIELAKGDFIYFLDSDDELYDENSIMNLVSKIKGNDLVVANYEVVDEMGNFIKNYSVNDNLLDFPDKYKYARVSPVPSNKLFLKSVIDKYNIYFSNVNIGQDLNFYLKYLSVCKKIKTIDLNVYKYRIVSNSITRSCSLNFMSIFDSFKRVEEFYNVNGMNGDYCKYITCVAAEHYRQQFSKVLNFKKRCERKMLFSFFDYCVKYNADICTNKNDYYKKQIKIYYLKKILIKLRFYNFIRRYKNDL